CQLVSVWHKTMTPRSITRTPAAPPVIAFGLSLLGAAVLLWPAPACAQSLDCRAARAADEATICAQPGLAQLDQELARRYGQERGRLAREQRDEFDEHESLFLNARRRCGDNARCIEQSYRNRIREF